MFCYKCGTKLNEGSAFCHKCGANLSVVHLSSQAGNENNQIASTEFDSEALKIYLHDVLTLECVTRKYLAELHRLDELIAHPHNYVYCVEDIFQKYDPRNASSTCFHLYYDGKRYYIADVSDAHYNSGVYTQDTLRGDEWRWLDIEDNLPYLKNQYAWRQSTYPATGRLQERKRRMMGVETFLKVYEAFRAAAPAEFQRFQMQQKEYPYRRESVFSEFHSAKKLLQKAYDCSIIPAQFRNIYAVHYLYTFLSTSNQSLSTALLHLDLKEIKDKLDKIIEQQEEMIINQSIIMSQNQQQIQQNQAHLRQLANIENNTEQAAQYAAIAANNAEVCAWIGLANYLKK